MEKIIVIDTETTSKYPENAKILEVAAVILENGIIADYYESLCNPGLQHLEGAEDALRVNGLTREQIASAPLEEKVREEFVKFIEAAKLSITSFNVHYDKVVMNTNGWSTLDFEWAECIMLAAKDIMGKAGALPMRDSGDFKFPSLNEAARFFDVGAGSHRALDDAKTAAMVWAKIIEARGR